MAIALHRPCMVSGVRNQVMPVWFRLRRASTPYGIGPNLVIQRRHGHHRRKSTIVGQASCLRYRQHGMARLRGCTCPPSSNGDVRVHLQSEEGDESKGDERKDTETPTPVRGCDVLD